MHVLVVSVPAPRPPPPPHASLSPVLVLHARTVPPRQHWRSGRSVHWCNQGTRHPDTALAGSCGGHCDSAGNNRQLSVRATLPRGVRSSTQSLALGLQILSGQQAGSWWWRQCVVLHHKCKFTRMGTSTRRPNPATDLTGDGARGHDNPHHPVQGGDVPLGPQPGNGGAADRLPTHCAFVSCRIVSPV